jgi:hypothetical protein
MDYIEAINVLGPRSSGKMDLPKMLEAFKRIGYSGTMTLDLYGYPLPVKALSVSTSRMREALKFLN